MSALRLQYVAGALALLLAACTIFPAPQSPAQSVYQMKAGFLVSLRLATQYAALPRCPAEPLCSEEKLVTRLRLSAEAAQTALDAAEAVVRDPAFKDEKMLPKAVTAARGAVEAFTALTALLQEKP